MTKDTLDKIFEFVEDTFNAAGIFETKLNATNNTIGLYYKGENKTSCFATIHIASILEYVKKYERKYESI